MTPEIFQTLDMTGNIRTLSDFLTLPLRFNVVFSLKYIILSLIRHFNSLFQLYKDSILNTIWF